MAPGRAISPAGGAIPPLTIASDRWDAARGGREAYLCELARFAAGRGDETVWRRARPGERIAPGEGPLLAAIPVEGASHYQLHSGLYREAFEAERESFSSFLRRGLFRPAMRWNAGRRALLRAERSLLERRDGPRLMVFSHALRGRIERAHGARDITVERPGVDTVRFHPAPDPPEAAGGRSSVRLLFVGHSFELKGLGTLLGALGLHRARGGRSSLTVAGAGPIGRFRRDAARRGLSGVVEFAGRVSRDAMPRLYRSHHALVHPTFYDPFSLAVGEALASGLPVVTTRRNGASEIMESGREGFVVEDPRDEEAIAGALDRLADPETRREMGRRAALLSSLLDGREHFARVLVWLSRAAARE